MRRLSFPPKAPIVLLLLFWQRRPKSGESEHGSRHGRPAPRRKLSPSASELVRSVDLSTERERLDVERHFSAAVQHIRATPPTPYVAEQRMTRDWKETVSATGVDGHAAPRHSDPSDGAPPSLFDEGSVDIRPQPAHRRGRPHGQRHRAAAAAARGTALSPDVLQLSGGNPKQHGLALANASNAAPADATIEPEELEGFSVYGDTPVQLTDMLKERLMELKAERLRGDRNDTYLPRRLELLSDSELQQQQQQQRQEQRQRKRCEEAKTKAVLAHPNPSHSRGPCSFRRAATTMADLADDAEEALLAGETAVVPRANVAVAAGTLREKHTRICI